MDARTAAPTVTAAGLVGRDAELRTLIAGLEAAINGDGRLFLVAGEPGIGKTRLALAVASEGEELLLVGDALHHPFQVELPGWPSPADADPARGAEARRRVLTSASERGAFVGASHLAEPFGRVEEGRWVSA